MLIVEDGTGIEDANTLVSLDELVAFAAARGIVLPDDDAGKELLLTEAMDFINSISFTGSKLTRDQGLSWPRKGVVVDGFSYAPAEIPKPIKRAQLQLVADQLEANVSLMGNVISKGAERRVVEESVEGAVSTKYEYADETTAMAVGGASTLSASGVQLTRATALLRPFIARPGQIRVRRG